MSRIAATFRRLSRANEAALIPYVTVGYPSLDITRTLLPVMARQGVDLIVLGVPYREPLYGGGAMLRISYSADDVTVDTALTLAQEARRTNEIPLVLMSHLSPVLDYGANFQDFVAAVAAAGIDGLIIRDLPPEETEYLVSLCEGAGVDFVVPVPQSGMSEQLGAMVEMASGFVYCVSPGVKKGSETEPLPDTAALVSEVRQHTDLPVVVDSHLGTPEHVAEMSRFADGVVASGALVEAIDSLEGDEIILGVSDYLRSLKEATHR